MTVTIVPVDPSDSAAIAAWYDLSVAAVAHDLPGFPLPGRHRHERQFEFPWAGRPRQVILAYHRHTMVGFATAMLPVDDNTNLLIGEVTVHPQHRRRGYGTALLGRLFDIARAEKRELMELTTVVDRPGGPPRNRAGEEFTRRLGVEPALVQTRRRLTIADGDERSWAELAERAWIHADGYTLRQWQESAPEDAVADQARLEARLVLDAPMGDLTTEPEAIDVQRIRADERTRAGRGDRTYTTVARHEATGTIAATTTLSIEHGVDHHAWQFITLVDPGHRGHRLGLIVKLANLSHTLGQENQLREVDTWNAASNEHMIRVNETIGYRPVDQWHIWQVPVPTAP